MLRSLLLLLLASLAMPAAAAATAPKGPIVLAILTPDAPLEEGEYLWEPERARTTSRATHSMCIAAESRSAAPS
jgi:hypothetical protein